MQRDWPHPRGGANDSSPQLMTDIAGRYQYGVYVSKSTLNFVAIRRDRTTNIFERFDLSQISGNPLNLPIYDETDDHYTGAVGIDANNVLHLTCNQHSQFPPGSNGHQNYVTCDNVAAFSTAASWTYRGNPPPFGSEAINGAGTYTYNFFDRMANGQLWWWFNQNEGDYSSAAGLDWLAYKRVSGAWQPVIPGSPTFIQTVVTGYYQDGLGDGYNADGSALRAYIAGILPDVRNGVERIHAWGIWRTSDSNPDTQQKPWYIYSDNQGVTWRSISGVVQPMPITWWNKGGSEIPSPPAPAISANTSSGMALDRNGYPSVMLRNGRTTDTSTYDRLYWNGTWQTDPNIVRPYACKLRTWRNDIWLQHPVGPNSARLELFNLRDQSKMLIGRECNGFSANPDPVLLRQGIYAVLMPRGNTPIVYEYGESPRS